MSSELAIQPTPTAALGFSDAGSFDHILKVAKMFADSQLVPVAFQKNVPNVVIALEISQRTGASALMVMQNLHIIHGKPSFGASFMIATVNACNRFTPLRFVQVGERGTDEWGCYAFAKAKADNFECKGVTVTIAIAKKEGWMNKSGSKWQSMPELMLQYRAATWWIRAFAPELLMGFPTQEEVLDIEARPSSETEGAEATPPEVPRKKKGVAAAKAEPMNVTPPIQPSVDNAHVTAGCEKFSEVTIQHHDKPTAEKAPSPSGATETQEPAPTNTSTALPARKYRCEVVAVEEKQAKKAGGVVGPVCTVSFVGDYEGPAYFDGERSTLPSEGAVCDVVLVDRMLKDKPVKIVTSLEVLAA